MPSRIECRGCHGTDVSVVKREPVMVGRFIDHIVYYQCNTCGATWSSIPRQT
jgi:hypothetical protein